MDEAVPRFTRHVEAPAAVRTRTLVALVATAVVLALRSPLALGLTSVLPMVFAWLGYRTLRVTPAEGYTVRLYDEVLEVEGPRYVATTRLALIRRLVVRLDALVVELPSGPVSIPLPREASARSQVLDAFPPQLPRETPAAESAPVGARRTLAVWVLLLSVGLVIHCLLRGR